jgi:hypothetical protein
VISLDHSKSQIRNRKSPKLLCASVSRWQVGSCSRQRFQHLRRAGVVAKRLTHMDEEVLISRREDKAAAELQRVFAQTVLFVAGSLCAAARLHVVTAQQVKQGSVAQTHGFVGLALFVDQERELDAGLLAEEAGVACIAQADYGQLSALLFEFFFEFAQLRDVLAAENSTVMAKEDQHCRRIFPERAQARCLAFGVGKSDAGQFAAEGLCHGGDSHGCSFAMSSALRMRANKDSCWGDIIGDRRDSLIPEAISEQASSRSADRDLARAEQGPYLSPPGDGH